MINKKPKRTNKKKKVIEEKEERKIMTKLLDTRSESKNWLSERNSFNFISSVNKQLGRAERG